MLSGEEGIVCLLDDDTASDEGRRRMGVVDVTEDSVVVEDDADA